MLARIRDRLPFYRRVSTLPPAGPRCAECPLAACASGCRAAVLGVECESTEAQRLRNLGLFEGTFVTVLDVQGGMVLEVKGSRLAVGPALASAIRVLPLPA